MSPLSRASAAVACALALPAAGAVVIPDDPAVALRQVADRLHGSVVEVSSELDQSPAPRFGTGVSIGDGRLLTTLHTVGTAREGKLVAASQVRILAAGAEPAPAQVLATFPALDLALLRVADAPEVSVAPSPAVPAPGDPLIVIGSGGPALTAVGVTLSSVDGDLLLLSSDRLIDSRFWGGPVLDAQGRMVGLCVVSLGQPAALRGAALQRLLARVAAP